MKRNKRPVPQTPYERFIPNNRREKAPSGRTTWRFQEPMSAEDAALVEKLRQAFIANRPR